MAKAKIRSVRKSRNPKSVRKTNHPGHARERKPHRNGKAREIRWLRRTISHKNIRQNELHSIIRFLQSNFDALSDLFKDTQSQQLVKMFAALAPKDQKLIANLTWRLYQKRKLN